MPEPRVRPYGSWKSPITSDLIVSGSIGVSQPLHDGGDIYWIEMRPTEGGRSVIVKRDSGGVTSDITPPSFNARTRAHEYGGGDYTVHNGSVYFSNFSDQRLYVQRPGEQLVAITPDTLGAHLRYADAVVDSVRQRLICVREDHTVEGSEAVNSL